MYTPSTSLVVCIAMLYAISIAMVVSRRGRGRAVVIYFFLFWTGIQYFLSPVLAYLSGGWKASLLFADSADLAIWISILYVGSVTLGYACGRLFETRRRVPRDWIADLRSHAVLGASRQIIIILTAFAVTLLALGHLVKYGSLENILFSSVPRGYGQFDEKGLRDILSAALRGASLAAGAFCAIMIGTRLGNRSRVRTIDFVIAILLLLVCAAALFDKFSRASGVLMVLAAIAIFIPGKPKAGHTITAAVLAMLGLYLCIVGITQRSALPGVASFLQHAVFPDVQKIGDFMGEGPNANFFDAIAPMSAHLHFSDRSGVSVPASLKDMFFTFQPLPASIFGQPVRFGASLSDSMGTWGSTGITKPALAELYYLFGWGYLFWGVLHGWFLRRVDLMLSESSRLTKYLVLVMAIGGIVVSGHSGLRAFARPTVLAAIVMWLSGRTYVLGKFKLAL